MRIWQGAAFAGAMMAAGAAAAAGPSVEIRDAAVRVTIVPETRGDVSAVVVRANRRLPLTLSRNGASLVIDGGLRGRGLHCRSLFGRPGVWVMGVGDVARGDFPQVVIHTPMTVSVSAGGAVFGDLGRGAAVDLANAGCGDWTVANVEGPLAIHAAGSGDIRAGSAAAADIRVVGSADVYTRALRGGLRASASGSGDIHAQSVDGPLYVRVAGSGDVEVRGGAVTHMDAAVAGSGDVTLRGAAQSLDASVAGSGDITVGNVTGAVSRHVAGSGDVRIGG